MSVDRPQYGEYATPEEQRAAAGLPPLGSDATASPSGHPTPSGHHVPARYGSAPAAAPPHGTAPAHLAPHDAAQQGRVPGAPARAANPAGRIVTLVLLALGLINVASSIPGFLDLSTTLNTSLQMLGAEGEFSNFAAARVWGTVAAIVLVVGYAATAWVSLRRLKRGRSAWWIPLVGFAATMLIVSLCLTVPMMGDPAFVQTLPTPPAG